MELFEKVLQGKILFYSTHLKRKEIFSKFFYKYTFFAFKRNNSIISRLIMIHELPQVTDLNHYLYQYLIVVEQGSKKAVQLVCNCTEYAIRCSQNSATVQLVLLWHP